jgi:predicted MFS family arabinose efflux permease
LFSKYQTFLIVILALLQFTVVLDFMVLSPLGAVLLKELSINAQEFGWVVSAYAFSAGLSGILSAGFADKYDRKKYLLFFYIGFLLGTLMCAMAETYTTLLIARIVTGIFGGVISSISFAIGTDSFNIENRGRVIAYIQMAFSASQVLGIPIGLKLAELYNWHAVFYLIVILGFILGIVIWLFMKPVNAHLALSENKNAFRHLKDTLINPNYLKGFLATILLSTGGYMMMPFASAFSTNNLGIALKDLPYLFGATGIVTILTGPLVGKQSDKIGRFKIFFAGSLLSVLVIVFYTRLGPTPLPIVMAFNGLMFIGISARIIASSSLISMVPRPQDRGAFMSINSSIQQLSGGIAAAIAGLIVVKTSSGKLLHYEQLGLVVICTMTIASIMIYRLEKHILNQKVH